MVDRNLLSSDPQYAGDPDNLLNQMDTVNRLAFGPLYAPRNALVGAGAGPAQTLLKLSPRDFIDAVQEGQTLHSAVISPDGNLHLLTGGASGEGAHTRFFENNPSAADTHISVRAFPNSVGISPWQKQPSSPWTDAQQRTVGELQRRYLREGVPQENIRITAPSQNDD